MTATRRVHSGSEQITRVLLKEHLDGLTCAAIPLAMLADHVRKEMKINENALRHMLPELGWHAAVRTT